ncbi:HTH-type transcriptional regulator UlaR [Gallibacterium trehalosifermentans]|uniref:HTH-type transcriptional regulator UlaR n=1 Tax=Gallibacterium trehalosifermentans TaxID=516935 RepID=A0ABV6H1H5_9PAST
MNEQIRHQKILTLLAQKKIASTPELIDYLGVSPATIRRDIKKLDQLGKLRKIRNGAELITNQSITKPLLTEPLSSGEKQRIATAAAALCKDGESVILTCGSTMMMLGIALCGRNVQIITNYLPLANYLIEHNHEQVVIMGGQYNKGQAITVSLNSNDETFAANTIFTSGKGLTIDGLYKTDMLIANSEQRLLSRSARLVTLVDSSKLGNAVGMLFTELTNIDVLVTGKEAPPDIINTIRNKGITVITV